jgi:hypothetical protein
LNARIALKNEEELAHPTRFKRVTFAFGGQRYLDDPNVARAIHSGLV